MPTCRRSETECQVVRLWDPRRARGSGVGKCRRCWIIGRNADRRYLILIRYNKIKRRNSALLNHWKKGGSKIFDIDNKIKRRNSASKLFLNRLSSNILGRYASTKYIVTIYLRQMFLNLHVQLLRWFRYSLFRCFKVHKRALPSARFATQVNIRR